jgi:predicted PhzF superfamily epimerase YddE/YHI9
VFPDCGAQSITALSETGAILCRVFASKFGIPEDPVTGSMYTVLGPYWEKKTGVKQFKARQCSKRGGDITVLVGDDGRAIVGGKATGVMEGTLFF